MINEAIAVQPSVGSFLSVENAAFLNHNTEETWVTPFQIKKIRKKQWVETLLSRFYNDESNTGATLVYKSDVPREPLKGRKIDRLIVMGFERCMIIAVGTQQ